jgi:hypothetical protein
MLDELDQVAVPFSDAAKQPLLVGAVRNETQHRARNHRVRVT